MGTKKSCQKKDPRRQNNKRKRNNRKTKWDRRNAELVISDISKNREEGDLVPDLVTEVRAD